MLLLRMSILRALGREMCFTSALVTRHNFSVSDGILPLVVLLAFLTASFAFATGTGPIGIVEPLRGGALGEHQIMDA